LGAFGGKIPCSIGSSGGSFLGKETGHPVAELASQMHQKKAGILQVYVHATQMAKAGSNLDCVSEIISLVVLPFCFHSRQAKPGS